MLATPCATSSQFERCRRPVMLSATTAESRLSIPPSSAKDSAAGRTAAIFSIESVGQLRQRQRLRDAAEARADGLDRQMQQPGDRPKPAPRRSDRPASAAGSRRTARMTADRQQRRRATADGLTVGSAAASACSFGTSGPGLRAGEGQAEQVLELAGEDDDGDAGGEADGHRIGNVLDEGAEPQQPDRRAG